MPLNGSPIYLSTMLLEKNRSNGKGPSLLVSDWMEPISEAGFGGLEIWMNHLRFSSRSEWELIRELGQEADLATAMIASALPIDASDKSQRLRESILEACDYFRPEGLKLALGGAGEEALDFLRTWSRDVPRDIGLYFDCPEGEGGVSGLEAVREALSGGRFRAVIHPFLFSSSEFEKALETYGDFIGNLGVQCGKGGQWAQLAESQDLVLKILAAARKRGYKGAWTLEYTKGAGLPKEDIEALFDNAEADLNFLTDILARTAVEKV
jgi:hypothetical protein